MGEVGRFWLWKSKYPLRAARNLAAPAARLVRPTLTRRTRRARMGHPSCLDGLGGPPADRVGVIERSGTLRPTAERLARIGSVAYGVEPRAMGRVLAVRRDGDGSHGHPSEHLYRAPL